MIFKNTVPLVTEKIEVSDVLNVLHAFQETNSNSLLLSSGGGSVYSFVKLNQHFIERDMSVIGDGHVASLAAMFFFCGKFRVATPGSTFFIHEGRVMNGSGAAVTKGEAQMQAFVCEHENDIKGFRLWMHIWQTLVHIDRIGAELISKQTSLSFGTAVELIRVGHEFTVDDALKYGIIHDVIDGQQVQILPQFGKYQPW